MFKALMEYTAKNLPSLTKPLPRVDMWKMDNRPGGSHTFGYWPDGSKAAPNHPPKIKVVIPIAANGNYIGDPSPKAFFSWLNKCYSRPDLLTMKDYKNTFKV